MLNRIVAITMLVALISCNLSRFFVYAGFSLNQKYIASAFCENKNRPWLHCNGHCYLMKKLKQAEDKEKSTERHQQKNLFQEAFFAGTAFLKFYSELLKIVNTPYFSAEPPSAQTVIFHPPKQA